jgi:hypothetical protein
MRNATAGLVAMAVMLSYAFSSRSVGAQASPGSPSAHLVIPFLAHVTNPSDLGFEGGECEVDTAAGTMDCQFQQVFLTTSDVAPDTCLVTTNRYQRTFRRQAERSWVSTEGPEGECGLLNVVTLQDDGGVRWTMNIRRVVTSSNAPPACRANTEVIETLSWRNLRRPLPCRFVQPGGLSR